jgi:hypothetical protein
MDHKDGRPAPPRKKGVASPQSLARHYHTWQRAMHRTPHGKPIELKSEDFDK